MVQGQKMPSRGTDRVPGSWAMARTPPCEKSPSSCPCTCWRSGHNATALPAVLGAAVSSRTGWAPLVSPLPSSASPCSLGTG